MIKKLKNWFQVNEEDNQQSDQFIRQETKRAIIGGTTATMVIFLGSIVINVSSGSEARLLLEGMLPTIRFLCSAVMTSTSTILALMLTMLSLSSSLDSDVKDVFFQRSALIGRVSTGVFSGALLLLLLIGIPLSESQDVPQNWYSILYYTILAGSALLGGTLITVVTMLYNAINGTITMLHPNRESQFLHRQTNEAFSD